MEKKNVLIVDDEPQICKMLQRILEHRGYTTAVAADGDQALHLLDQTQFDLLLTDILMPNRNGLELLRLARERDPEMEAIVLTGHGNLDSAIEALRLGAYDYLQKPLHDVELFAHTVERALERRRLRLANRDLILELRAAKQHLEQQRASELERIEQIGRALSSNLQHEQIVELLQQALLTNDSYGCQVIALLAWDAQGNYTHLSVRSRQPLAAKVVNNICVRVVQLALKSGAPRPAGPIPEPLFGSIEKYHDAGEIVEPLSGLDYELLPVQGKPMGVLATFARDEDSLSDDCRHVFHILAQQAAVALDSIALFEQVRELSRRDGLTHLYNHLYFMDLLENEVRRSRRYRRPVSLLFIDIDHFKEVNDSLGHQAGDEVLVGLAQVLQEGVRDTDLVGRYGGEEFVVLLPEAPEREAITLAERLRRTAETRDFAARGATVNITLSVGVASYFAEQVGSGEDLVRNADEALLHAKAAGRNRVYSHFLDQVVHLNSLHHEEVRPQ